MVYLMLYLKVVLFFLVNRLIILHFYLSQNPESVAKGQIAVRVQPDTSLRCHEYAAYGTDCCRECQYWSEVIRG